MENCIFCKILKKEIPSRIVFEDDDIFAFYDIKPIVPVHVLIIPKKHISSINEVSNKDADVFGRIILKSSEIAKELGIADSGYKLLFRVGENGGQEVGHVHLHLLGGGKMYEDIRVE